jgi:hypothetical protein
MRPAAVIGWKQVALLMRGWIESREQGEKVLDPFKLGLISQLPVCATHSLPV